MLVNQALSKDLNTTSSLGRAAPGAPWLTHTLPGTTYPHTSLPCPQGSHPPGTNGRNTSWHSSLGPGSRASPEAGEEPCRVPITLLPAQEWNREQRPSAHYTLCLEQLKKEQGDSHSPVKNIHQKSKSSCQTVNSFIPSPPM